MYFHCQTTLVDTFKEIYHTQFEFNGNRSIIFSVETPVPVDELSHCISMALPTECAADRPALSSISRLRPAEHQE